MIVCRTLGPVHLTVDDQEPPPELLWRKHLALLVYLARSPRRGRTREHLVGLLWGDKSDRAARHSLREAIRVLRRAVGEDGLRTEHDQVRLADGAVRLDTEELEAAAAARDWARAASLIAGEFLEGFSVPDASSFEDWLNTERLQWRQRAVAALVGHARQLVDHGQVTEGCHVALRSLALDPASDQAVRAVMTGHALAGNRAAALEQFDRFAARAGRDGRRPDDETRALAERIRGAKRWRLPETAPAAQTVGAELRRAPLVGREDAFTRLLEVWRDCVARRQAAVAVVAADAGIGKSRLMDELVARARLEGGAPAIVRAVEADLAVPWSGLTGLARGGLLEASGVVGAAPGALTALAVRIPEWADRFGTSDAESLALPEAVTAVVEAGSGEQPVLLVLDDAHWCDRESLLGALALVRSLASKPVLVVLGVAPSPSRSELDDLRSRLGRDVPGCAIVLEPLGEAAIRTLAEWAVPAAPPEQLDRLARRVMSDSAGLPLLAVELLHAVALGLDVGALGGAWPQPLRTLDQTLPGDLPDAIVAAIRVGYRRLGTDAQRVLAAAAVLGDRVETAVLERATALHGDQLTAALDELEWQRWMLAESRGYAFVARIVRDVVARDMVTEGQRRRIAHAADSRG